MIELGMKQELVISKIVDFGCYLGEQENAEVRVLLPKKQVPEGSRIGDRITVFVYKDSKDRLISTVKEPMLQIGGVAVLTVLETSPIGAFLDWGLEKDLLLPFKEQTKRVQKGDRCLAALYVDKSSRLCATMNVYDYLLEDAPFDKDDHVNGTIYMINEEFGAFVAVENQYCGMIPKRELFSGIQIGDEVQMRVTNVREDGKLDLSCREKAYVQMDQDAETVLSVLEKYAGVLPFTDKAPPEVIKQELNLSKNAFKRAVGRLLKQGKVVIADQSIRIVKEEDE